MSSSFRHGRSDSVDLVSFGNPPTGEKEEHTPRSTLSRMFSGWMTPNISRTPHDVIGSPTADAAHLFVHRKPSGLSRLNSRSSVTTSLSSDHGNGGESFQRQISKPRSLSIVREPDTQSDILPHNEPRTSDWVKQRILALGDMLATCDEETDHSIYWAPDDQCRSCYQCGAQFTTFRRRHHCRICGQIYCWNCCHSRVDCSTVGIDEVMRLCVFCEKVVTDSSATIKETEVDDGRDSALSVDQLPTSTFLSKSVLPPTRFDSDREVASTAHLFIPPSFTGSAKRAAKLKAEAQAEEKSSAPSKVADPDIVISSPKTKVRSTTSADSAKILVPPRAETGSSTLDENEKEKPETAEQMSGATDEHTGVHKVLVVDGSAKKVFSEPLSHANSDMASGKQSPGTLLVSTREESVDVGKSSDTGVDLNRISDIMMKNIIAHALALHGKFKLGDRRFRLKTYSNCFVASDFIDWLLLGEYVSDRDAAIELGERMVAHDLIRSAADHENSFRDDYLLFRFTDTTTLKTPIAARYSIANLVPRPCLPNAAKEPSVSDGIYYQPADPGKQRGKDTLDMSLAKHKVKRSTSFFTNLPGVEVVRSSSLDPGILASLPSLASGSLDSDNFTMGALGEPKQQFGSASVATELNELKSSAIRPLGGSHSISALQPIPRLTKLLKEGESVIGTTTSKLPDAHEQSESAVDRLVESHTNRHRRTISRNAEADTLLNNSSGEPLKLGQNPRLRGKEFKSKLSNQVPLKPSATRDISLKEQKKTEDQYIRYISDAVRRRRLRMCCQILCDMGLSDSWVSTVESLAQEAVVQVRTPALGSADPMDIRQWIKTKIIPHGDKSDSQCIHGVVCAQHLVHKKMRSDIANPRILLLNSSIEYDQTHAITSMEDVFKKDQLLRSLQLQIDLIRRHRPDVVLVSGSVAYKAQEMFLAENISLAVNVKRSILDFVKRCTGAEIQESMAEMRGNKTSIVGTCGRFFIGTVTAGQPLMYFTECNPRRGVTITLRGADEATLKKVKQALSFITFVSYCGFIESFYLSDVFAVIPEEERDKENSTSCNIIDNAKKAHRDRFCSLARQSVLSTSPLVDFDIPYLYKPKGKAMLSYFPSGLYTTRRLQSANYQNIPIDLRTAYLLKHHPAEREPRKHLQSNPLPKPFDAVRMDWDRNSRYQPGEDIHFAMLDDEEKPAEKKAVKDNNTEETHSSNRKLASWDALNPAMHQSIQVLYSVELPGNGEQPARMCLKPKKMDFYYYGDKDQSLGSFLSRYCFNTHACPSETCDRPLSEHKRIFSHQDARISFINIPSNVIHGQEQTLLMWSICHECMKYGPCIPVSEETWCMSFGKFLELSFHEKTLGCRVTQITNESGMMKLVEDKHSFHRNHNRYYGLNDQAVVVQYDKIDMLLEVVTPPTIVTSKPVPLKCGDFLTEIFQLQKEMQGMFSSLSLQLACLYVRARDSGSQTFASQAYKLLRRSFVEGCLYRKRVDEIARHAHAKHIHGQTHTESEIGGITEDCEDDDESLRSAVPDGTYISDSSRRSSALREEELSVNSGNTSRRSSVASANVLAAIPSAPEEPITPVEVCTSTTALGVPEDDTSDALDQIRSWVVDKAAENSSAQPVTEKPINSALASTHSVPVTETDSLTQVTTESRFDISPHSGEADASGALDEAACASATVPNDDANAPMENKALLDSTSMSTVTKSISPAPRESEGVQTAHAPTVELSQTEKPESSDNLDIAVHPFREGPPSLTPDITDDAGTSSEPPSYSANTRLSSVTIEVPALQGVAENENVRDQLSPPPEMGGNNPALQHDLILAKEHTEAMERSKKYIQMRKASQSSDASSPLQTYHRFATIANSSTTIVRTPTEPEDLATPVTGESKRHSKQADEIQDLRKPTSTAEEMSEPAKVHAKSEDDDSTGQSYSRELPPPLPDFDSKSSVKHPSPRMSKSHHAPADHPRVATETAQDDCGRELPPPLPVSPSDSEEEDLRGMTPPSYLSAGSGDDGPFDADETVRSAGAKGSRRGDGEDLPEELFSNLGARSETRLPGSLLRLHPIDTKDRHADSDAANAATDSDKSVKNPDSLRRFTEEDGDAFKHIPSYGSAPLPRNLTVRSSPILDAPKLARTTNAEPFGEIPHYKFSPFFKPALVSTSGGEMSANTLLATAKANLKPLTGFSELLREPPRPLAIVSASTQSHTTGLSHVLDDKTAEPLVRHSTFPRRVPTSFRQSMESPDLNAPAITADNSATGPPPLPPAVDLLDDEAIFGEPMVTNSPETDVSEPDAGTGEILVLSKDVVEEELAVNNPSISSNNTIDSIQSSKPIESAAVRFLETGEATGKVVADTDNEESKQHATPEVKPTHPESLSASTSPILARVDTLESEKAYIEAKTAVLDTGAKPITPPRDEPKSKPATEVSTKLQGVPTTDSSKKRSNVSDSVDSLSVSSLTQVKDSLSASTEAIDEHVSRVGVTGLGRKASDSPASVRSVPTQSCIVESESEIDESTASLDPLVATQSDLENYKGGDLESGDIDSQESGIAGSAENLMRPLKKIPSDVAKAAEMIDEVQVKSFTNRRFSKKVSLADLRGEEIFNPDATVTDVDPRRVIETITEKDEDHADLEYRPSTHQQSRRATDGVMLTGSADKLVSKQNSQTSRTNSILRSKASSIGVTHAPLQPTEDMNLHSMCDKLPCDECKEHLESKQDAFMPTMEAKAGKMGEDKARLQISVSNRSSVSGASKISKLQAQRQPSEDHISEIESESTETPSSSTTMDVIPSTSKQAKTLTQKEEAGPESTGLSSATDLLEPTVARISDQELVGLHVTLMSDIDELVTFWNSELRRAFANSIASKDTSAKTAKTEGHSRWNTPAEFINLPLEMNDPNFDPAVELGSSPTTSIKQDTKQATNFLNVGSVMAAVQRARSSSYQTEDGKKNEADNGAARDVEPSRGKEHMLIRSGLITPEEAMNSRSRFVAIDGGGSWWSDAHLDGWSDILLSPPRNDQLKFDNFDLETMNLTPNVAMSPTTLTSKSPLWRTSNKVTDLDEGSVSAQAVALLPRRKFGQNLEEAIQETGAQTPPQEQQVPMSVRSLTSASSSAFTPAKSRMRAGASEPLAAMLHGLVPLDNFVTSSIDPRAATSTPVRFETEKISAVADPGEASDVHIEIGDHSDIALGLRALANLALPHSTANVDHSTDGLEAGHQGNLRRSISPRSSAPSTEPPRLPLTPIPSQPQDVFDFNLLDPSSAKKAKDDMEALCRSITGKTQPSQKQLAVPSLSKAHYQLPATELPYIVLVDDEPSTLIAYFLASVPYRKKLNEAMMARPRTESSADGHKGQGNPSVFENKATPLVGSDRVNATDPNMVKPNAVKQKTGGGPSETRKASRLKTVHNIAKEHSAKGNTNPLRDTSNDTLKPTPEHVDEKATLRPDRPGLVGKQDASHTTPDRTNSVRYPSLSPRNGPNNAYFKTTSQQKKSGSTQPKHNIVTPAPVRIPYTSIGGVDAPSVMSLINNRGQYSPNSGLLRLPSEVNNAMGNLVSMLGVEEPVEDVPSFSSDGQERKGSESPHIQLQVVDDTTVFGIRIVWARRFHRLRELCTEGEDKFIRSLSRCAVWEATGGKSGSTFLRTLDGRYILKQMSRVEVASVIDLSEAYLKYMFESIKANRPIVLAKVLGIYQISMVDRKTSKTSKVAFIVMENVFYGRKIDVAFDLKGSQRSRYAETSDKNAVLLDENFVEFITDTPIYLRGHTKLVLETAVASDALFLCNNNVMDYSLLIGMNYETKELVVGIIDYIRTYTLDKKMETWVKSSGILGGSGKMPTVISPNLYMKRFRSAVEDYFIRLPDKWTGKTIPLSYPDLHRDLKTGPNVETTNNTTLSPTTQSDNDTTRPKTHPAGEEKEKARLI